MNETVIDLTNYPKGATLDIVFNVIGKVAPFLVFITNESKNMVFYNRIIEGPKVSINLPYTIKKVILFSMQPVKQILTGPLRIFKMVYNFNTPIITPRSYTFDQIKTELLPFIPDQYGRPTDQPARFMPSTGQKQISQSVMHAYPAPTQEYISEHENGHYYYGRPLPPVSTWKNFDQATQKKLVQIHGEDEIEADRYAFYKLMNDGHNFSNLYDSVASYLSNNPESLARIKALKNTIINEHKKLGYEWN